MVDFVVLFFVAGALSIVIYIASGWRADLRQGIEISLDPWNIPLYSANSLVRIFFAYMLSLTFSIWYGYTANRSKAAEMVMIPILDILQSIPVLSFLPGFVLSLTTIFPDKRIGIELASILLIFTGQAWNMAFSYYSSMKTMPRELIEVTRIFRINQFSKFVNLDLPFAAIGLVWNSMMSVAGGWFFLMACEMFVLKDKDFRLPGIGSYIQIAAHNSDMRHLAYGLAAMVFMVVALDVFVWRPLVAWSQKFRFDTIAADDERESQVLNILRRAPVVWWFADQAWKVVDKAESVFDRFRLPAPGQFGELIRKIASAVVTMLAVGCVVWALYSAFYLFSGMATGEYVKVFTGAAYSLLRTSAAIFLAAMWTVPLGVYIGMNPRAAAIFQPIIQVVASIPATAVFPVILVFLIKLGGGLNIGSIFLMLLGTQWYILFNVIAGASAIPQDLIEAGKVYGLSGWRKWKVLILPGIFPYLVIGLITATGGAWNSTIVSEYVTYGNETLKTEGLGSIISEATASGNFGLLLFSTITMSAMVVSINRLLWKRLFLLAQEKYRID